jgi:hypothetical protein
VVGCQRHAPSVELLSETFLIARIIQPDMIITVYRSAACKVPVTVGRLKCDLKFLDRYSRIRRYENPSSRSRVDPYGQTDERT